MSDEAELSTQNQAWNKQQKAIQSQKSMRLTQPLYLGSDNQLDLARERADFLEAEVARLRAERTAMLNVIKAAKYLNRAQERMLKDWGEDGDGPFTRTRKELWQQLHAAGYVLGDALDLIGDDRE